MKLLIGIIATTQLLSFNAIGSNRIKNIKTEKVKVQGNRATCKTTIETAAFEKKISMAVWDENTKTAELSFDSTKTTVDAILKKIALAGYDNQNYLAPDAAYQKLIPCCKYARKSTPKEMKDHSEHHESANMGEMKSDSSRKETILASVYKAYFDVKDALVKGDGKTAAAKAKELYQAVDAVPMDKLGSSQHMIWMKYMKDISYNAEHIKSTTEIDHQREHFVKLSTAMYEVMKAIKAGYPVYYDHCPMYNDGKGGDWLSKESGIKNPYYGSQMLSCGSTKEVIK